MAHWLYNEFTKLSTIFIIVTQWIVHWEDIIDRIAGWLKLGHLFERRKSMNFVSGLLLAESEAVKISAFLTKLPTYLPLIQQNIADLQKAAADKSNPAALMTDVSALLNDLNSDLTVLVTVLPALAPTNPTPTPPVTPAA